MKNNAESVSNPAGEPQKKIEAEDDTEALMKAFEEIDKAKEAAANDVDPAYKALQEENEASLEADIAGERSEAQAARDAEKEKFITAYVMNNKDASGREAYGDIYEAFDEHLDDAIDLAVGQPEDAVRLLASPAELRLMTLADPQWNDNMEKLGAIMRPAYAKMAREIRAKTAQALKRLLEVRMDQEEDPPRISAMHKLLEAAETYGSKYE